MEAWVGPAIVAALVSGLVSALGWFVTSWQALRLEQLRREEKVHDYQVALWAEIGSELKSLKVVEDRHAFLDGVRHRFATDVGYVPFVPRLAGSPVFEALVPDIQILPGDVIAPVITYARFRQTVERFIDDLRDSRYAELATERRLAMFCDYIGMLERLQFHAEAADASLSRSLAEETKRRTANSSDADPQSPAPASAFPRSSDPP